MRQRLIVIGALLIGLACGVSSQVRIGTFDGLTIGTAGITIRGATAAEVLVARRTLTNAEIKPLPTTPITVVAAPGVGYRLVILLATAHVHAAAGHYTNVDAGGFAFLQYGTSHDLASNYIANDAGQMPALIEFDNFLKTYDDSTVVLSAYTQDSDPASTQWGNVAFVNGATRDNESLQIKIDNNGAGNLTGGNAANTMKVTVFYSVEPT